MIDPHVHLRDWNQADKETVFHGLFVAAACGFELLFDMPNCNPPLTDRGVIERRLGLAADAVERIKRETGRDIRYGLYAGLTSDEAQIREVVTAWDELFPNVVGLKLFAGNSTGDMGQVSEERQRHIYHELAKDGYTGVLAVHCEKESFLLPQREDPSDFSTHSLARPIEAEVASVSDQIRFAEEEEFRGILHICHLSTVESLPLIERGRADGLRITCGVTPHHLLLCSEDARNRCLYAKMNPPLRDEAHRAALFGALLDGRIDWVESDHAPHTLSEKEKGACGIPGFSGSLTLLQSLYKAGIPEIRLRSLFGKRVLDVFGLPPQYITIPSYDECSERSEWAAMQYPYDSYRKYHS
ncbi:MAG: dihydroorotase family protein [Sphaerochaetaceae bacterium]